MYALLAKLAEILSDYGSRFLEGAKARGDTAVAASMAQCLLALQDICVRGELILRRASSFLDGPVDDQAAAELADLVAAQSRALEELQKLLGEQKALLATIDPGLYLELAPLLDNKSGLLTRWQQQASQSGFSTTTLFFLPREDLQRVLEVGRAQTTPAGLDPERTGYLLVVADTLRAVRSGEIRDIRRVTGQQGDRLASELRAARSDLERAKALCGELLASTERAVGPEALAGLRRKQARGSR